MTQGIQIAQRRSLITTDPVVQRCRQTRVIVLPPYDQPGYYSIRFMGSSY